MGVGGQRHSPGALPQGKTRYQLCRRLGGHQDRSGRVRKISPLPEFEPGPSSPWRIALSTELSQPLSSSRSKIETVDKKNLHSSSVIGSS